MLGSWTASNETNEFMESVYATTERLDQNHWRNVVEEVKASTGL
jgi:hypothetical protein